MGRVEKTHLAVAGLNNVWNKDTLIRVQGWGCISCKQSCSGLADFCSPQHNADLTYAHVLLFHICRIHTYRHAYIHKASDPRNMQFPICTSKKNSNGTIVWLLKLVSNGEPHQVAISLDLIKSCQLAFLCQILDCLRNCFLQYARLNYTSIDMSQAASSLVSRCEITSEVLVQTER